MDNEYIPQVSEDVWYYDKRFNYQKKTGGKVTKITDKYIYVDVKEQDIIKFDRTDAFEDKKSIDAMKIGDSIKFKRNSKQKEYYEGIITNIGFDTLEIEYINDYKIEPVLLDKNFSLEKIKKIQELHGKKIKDSVYEKRIDKLLTTSADEQREKLKKSVKFYTKNDAFPEINVFNLLDKGASPSLVMFQDFVQKNFSGNNCKSLDDIDSKDKCNEFYIDFGNAIASSLKKQKTLDGAKEVISEVNELLRISGEDEFNRYIYEYGDDEKRAKERYWDIEKQNALQKWIESEEKKGIKLSDDDKTENSYKFINSHEYIQWSDAKWQSELKEKSYGGKNPTPLLKSQWTPFLDNDAVSRRKKAYDAYANRGKNLKAKYKADVDQKYIDTLSDNFKDFISLQHKKDKLYIDDIEAIASFEKNFSADAIESKSFNYYTPEKGDLIDSKDQLSDFVKNFLISKQVAEYMQGKGGVKTKVEDIHKIIKIKDENLKENRFNLESIPIDELDKKIQDEFGLRAIQYGISVQQGSENYKHILLELVYGSLKDLSKATNLDPIYIGLGNAKFNSEDQKERDAETIHNLGLAIGARGQGDAMAHYESDENVINLTKNRGNGSLAHEWGHALDRYLRDALNDPARIKKAQYNFKKLQEEMTFDDVVSNLRKYEDFTKKYFSNSAFNGANFAREKFLSQGIGDILIEGYEETEFSKDIEKLVIGIRNSNFCDFSRRIDPKYLGTNEECFARAFSSFVGDTTNNRFLATNTNEYSIDNDRDLMEKIGNDKMLLGIYPQDEYWYGDDDEPEKGYAEREIINDLFADVFSHKKELQDTINRVNAEKFRRQIK